MLASACFCVQDQKAVLVVKGYAETETSLVANLVGVKWGSSECGTLFLHLLRVSSLAKDWTNLSVSQTDCYISLSLPTASPETVRTKTIKNCKDPVWNETFCFRIQSQVKNILEMKVYDENAVTKDDLLFTVLFDVAKIQLGETVHLTFQLNPKTQEMLEVEFTLESIPVPPEKLVTNGVLVSREISCLEVLVDNRWTKKEPSEKDFLFSVKGSYEKSQTLSLGSFWQPLKPLNFHYIKYSLSELCMALAEKKPHFCSVSGEDKKDCHASLTIPLDSLPFSEKVAVAKDETVNLHVKSNDWNPGLCLRSRNLDVRLEFDLCTGEKNFLQKRKKFVASALKKALQLEQDLQDHEVPVVAVMTTGGGTRALTSLLGNLLGLQKLGLLDAISYITGSSGSTWTLSHLYQSADWSHKDLSTPIGEVRRHMTKCKLSCFSLESLKYYAKELKLRKQEGYQISSVDFWGLLLEKALDNGKNNHKLSDEQEALSQGQNPLPIYMILNIKEDYSLSEFKEWVEFTPYEVGFLKYGAFIRAEDFGSEFFMGRLMKKLPESRICFMKGLWSNVFSYNLLDAWHSSNPTQRRSLRCTQHSTVDIGGEPSPSDIRHELETYLVTPECGIMGIIRRILTERVMVSKFYNFLKGFQLHNEYLWNKNFCIWKDTVLEHFPNQLTETAEFMCLADTAGYIDISYPPLMRPERKVDVVLHLNYSSGSQTLPLEEASKYFQKQGIPFPKIQMSEEEKKNLKECYIFEDTETPEAPTVVFFPLVNDSFRKYKEPGVERSPAEMAHGNVDVSTISSPYCLNSFTYTGEEFDKLIDLTSYNIQNNQHLILQALNSAIEQKRQHKK
uniref:cytosolic phospholipase A2 epsilon n=1 Tax=Lonchura striata TaxID=40157 RepID=UPI001293DFA3|nr:cytosolic phospholipase A2 epsilon [Lonchura striata domestica]